MSCDRRRPRSRRCSRQSPSCWSRPVPRRGRRPAARAAVAGVPPGYRPLTIKTLPPLPGVRLVLDGQTLVTGADGTVRTLITKEDRDALAADRDAHLRVISNDVTLSPGVRGRFHGWYQEGYHFTPQNPVGAVRGRGLRPRLPRRLHVRRSRTTGVLDARGITDVQLRNSLGGLVDIGKPKPVWLRGARRRIVARNGRPEGRGVAPRVGDVPRNEHRAARAPAPSSRATRRRSTCK